MKITPSLFLSQILPVVISKVSILRLILTFLIFGLKSLVQNLSNFIAQPVFNYIEAKQTWMRKYKKKVKIEPGANSAWLELYEIIPLNLSIDVESWIACEK